MSVPVKTAFYSHSSRLTRLLRCLNRLFFKKFESKGSSHCSFSFFFIHQTRTKLNCPYLFCYISFLFFHPLIILLTQCIPSLCLNLLVTGPVDFILTPFRVSKNHLFYRTTFFWFIYGCFFIAFSFQIFPIFFLSPITWPGRVTANMLFPLDM